MRVLVAPDSFKGTLSAPDAAKAIAIGLRRALPDVEIDSCPMADGGQGIIDAFSRSVGGELIESAAHDPLGRPIHAPWCFHAESKTAVLELAAASGYERLAKNEHNPMNTTTFGTGELMVTALLKGAKKVLVGLGDSATIDAGLGLCQALGLKLLGIEGHMTGSKLRDLQDIDRSKMNSRLTTVEIIAAYDVEIPLCGPDGAVAVFGKQKGATQASSPALEAGLQHIASRINPSGAALPGSGAAGGAAFGMREILGAKLVRGVDLVMNFVNFDARVERADLVITGEGQLDAQSLKGKTCVGISRRAQQMKVPVVAIAGSIVGDRDRFKSEGIQHCYALADMEPNKERAMTDAAQVLSRAAEMVLRQRLSETP